MYPQSPRRFGGRLGFLLSVQRLEPRGRRRSVMQPRCVACKPSNKTSLSVSVSLSLSLSSVSLPPTEPCRGHPYRAEDEEQEHGGSAGQGLGARRPRAAGPGSVLPQETLNLPGEQERHGEQRPDTYKALSSSLLL